jgi:hypothetical protein
MGNLALEWVCSPKEDWRRMVSGSRQVLRREQREVMKPRDQSLVGITEEFVPCVHHVKDGHVLPQSIAGQHGLELYGEW